MAEQTTKPSTAKELMYEYIKGEFVRLAEYFSMKMWFSPLNILNTMQPCMTAEIVLINDAATRGNMSQDHLQPYRIVNKYRLQIDRNTIPEYEIRLYGQSKSGHEECIFIGQHIKSKEEFDMAWHAVHAILRADDLRLNPLGDGEKDCPDDK